MFARIEAFYDCQQNGYVHLGFAGLMRRATGELIVDGAILTEKLAAYAVTATKVAAGAIQAEHVAANAIAANKLVAASRPVSVTGLALRITAAPARLQWDAGTVITVSDAGVTRTQPIAAFTSAEYVGSPTYIVWNAVAGSASFDLTTDATYTTDPRFVHVGTWEGGSKLTVVAGAATLINGGQLVAQTVAATVLIAKSITSEQIQAGGILAESIRAGTITGDRFDITTSLPGTITIGTTGVSIATTQERAADPAARINANTTLIESGRLRIQGGTTLNSYFDGTEIIGGKIKTGSVTADKLTLNSRGLDVSGIDFSYDPATGQLVWTSGFVHHLGDNGQPQETAIVGNRLTWRGGTYNYVFYGKGVGGLGVGVDNWQEIYADPNRVVLCIWANGPNFIANYGGTIIHGDRITTRTIAADRLNVNALSAITANVGDLTAGVIRNAAGSARFDLTAGIIQFKYASVMKVTGAGFGTAGQFVEWVGPPLDSISQCAESNAKFYIRTDGTIFTSGQFLAGSLRAGNQNPSTATSVTADTGAIGSNGGAIGAQGSWTYSRKSSLSYAPNSDGLTAFRDAANNLGMTNQGNGSWLGTRAVDMATCTLTIAKEGSDQATVQVTQYTRTCVGQEPTPGDAPGRIDISYVAGASLTFADPERSTRQRSFQARLARSSGLSGDGDILQRVAIATVE
jgi:hypothetical protein